MEPSEVSLTASECAALDAATTELDRLEAYQNGVRFAMEAVLKAAALRGDPSIKYCLSRTGKSLVPVPAKE